MDNIDLERIAYRLSKVYKSCYMLQAQSQIILDELLELGYDDNDEVFLKHISQMDIEELSNIINKFNKSFDIMSEHIQNSTQNIVKSKRILDYKEGERKLN